MFDRDKEGISEYKLDKNFVIFSVANHEARRGIHGKSFAALLPVPPFRNDCLEYSNLPIEFLFRDEHLEKSVDGSGLSLRLKKASIMVGERKIEKPLDDFTHFKDIVGGKVDFAEKVIPTLDADAFDAFDKIFELIESLISYDKSRGR